MRCGQCLQVFDAGSGDVVFVAPQVSSDEPEPDFAGITINPAANVDLAADNPPAALSLKLLAMLLLLALMGQILWHNYPLSATADAVAIKQLIVREHPELDNALQLDSVLLNESGKQQPYPDLLLRFENRYGETTAQRLFAASEYLPYPPNPTGLAPQTRVQVNLSLLNPGPRSVNYSLLVMPHQSMQN